MHTQLWETDVNSVQRNLHVGQVAQSAAASQVGTVVEELVRSVCFFADGFEYCGGNAVGAVVLSGVCFDNNTFVHEDTVGFVANFRMVWMNSMSVVSGNHEGRSDCAVVIFFGSAHCGVDAFQGINHEGGFRALFGTGANFFVVEYAENGNGFRVLALQEAFHGYESTFQVIQFRTGHVFAVSAPDAWFLTVVEEEVNAEDGIFSNAGSFCNNAFEGTFGGDVAVYWQHINLWVVFVTGVDFTVHMDCHVRDHQQVFVYVNQFGFNAVAFFYENAASDGQWTVKPGRRDHTAVWFGVQDNVFACSVHFMVFFQFVARSVRMACGDMEGSEVSARNFESDYGGLVAGYKVVFASFQVPTFAFGQFNKAIFQQFFADVVDCMEAAWGIFDKLEQFMYAFVVHEKSLLL